jgi:membrane protein
MPNIKVRFLSALMGGIAGGTLWQLGQWGYVHFQVGVARYNAIYGTLAALPIFMVWIYISWVIVLLGLEVTYASQNLKTIRQEIRGNDVNLASRERIALTIMLVLARAFLRGETPWSRERIGQELELPPRLVAQVLNLLVRLRFLSVVQLDGGDGYQPGRSPETTRVIDLLDALRDDGVSYEALGHQACLAAVNRIEQGLAGGRREVLQDLTFREMLRSAETDRESEAVEEGE